MKNEKEKKNNKCNNNKTFKEVRYWKRIKFVSKYFGCMANSSAVEGDWLHSSRVTLGWSRDNRTLF